MNQLNTEILRILEEDCRYTPAKIAVMLDRTEAEVIAAIEEMEQQGVIVKYTAIVNGERLADEVVQALIEVKVSPQKSNGFDAIAEEIYRFDEVKSCYLMSGGYDLAVFIEGKTLRRASSPSASPRWTTCSRPPPTSSSKNTRSKGSSPTGRTITACGYRYTHEELRQQPRGRAQAQRHP